MNKILFLLFLSVNALAQIEPSEYPAANADTVRDHYFGAAVSDPYRWLENDTLAATQEWLREEWVFLTLGLVLYYYSRYLKPVYSPPVVLAF